MISFFKFIAYTLFLLPFVLLLNDIALFQFLVNQHFVSCSLVVYLFLIIIVKIFIPFLFLIKFFDTHFQLVFIKLNPISILLIHLHIFVFPMIVIATYQISVICFTGFYFFIILIKLLYLFFHFVNFLLLHFIVILKYFILLVCL